MIRKIATAPIFILFIILTFAGCHRQKLEEILYTKALIPVLIDWETRALLYIDNDPDHDLYSASVWLFPREGSEYQGSPIEYKLENAIYDYIDVPIGIYDVLVFNKTVGEFSSNVGFRGMDKFNTFEYYTVPYTNSKSEKVYDGDREIRLEPDMLAAWRSASDSPLVVTADMIRKMSDIVICREYLAEKYLNNGSGSFSTRSTSVQPSDFDSLSVEMRQLVDLKPERLTHITPIEESLHNLHSVSMAIGTLSGMSSSVKLAAAEYSTTQTAYKFLFSSKTIISEDKKDGHMDATFRVIGPLHMSENANYQLKNEFTLTQEFDGSYSYPIPPNDPISFDVTDQVYQGQELLGLDKVIPITISLEEGIYLPDAEFGSGSLDVNINDWDDEIKVPITTTTLTED